jgi:hypothetical protein
MKQQVRLILFDVGFPKEPRKVQLLLCIIACTSVITKHSRPTYIQFYIYDLQLKSFILYSIHEFVKRKPFNDINVNLKDSIHNHVLCTTDMNASDNRSNQRKLHLPWLLV